MNLDEALTYQGLQHTYKPQSCPRWEAGWKQRAGREKETLLHFFFITDKLGEPLLGSLPIGTFSRAGGGNEKAGTVFT